MKSVLIKILCWTAGIGAVGYVGLTVANSIPSISRFTTNIPIIKQIPTPAIDSIAEASMSNSCKSEFGDAAEVVRISDAPKSEGSYHRWECVVKNPNKTEAEYQEYLVELGKYKEWPRDPDFNFEKYNTLECKYYDGIFFKYVSYRGASQTNYLCVTKYDQKYYESKLETSEDIKKNSFSYEIIDFSKEV